MKATIEISLYPLDEKYEQIVTDFILEVKREGAVELEVNGLSTQLFGDYEVLMNVVKNKMQSVLEKYPAVFVMKIAKGELKKEKLPETLR